ncbi:MAG: S10 family peptidase [Phycisphaerales bacterium JB059]
MNTTRRLFRLMLCLVVLAPVAAARGGPEEEGERGARADFQRYPEHAAVTAHRVELKAGVVDYLAVADTMALVDEQDEEKARIFFIAYRRVDRGEGDAGRAREALGEEAYERIATSSAGEVERGTMLAQAMVEAGEDPLEVFGHPDPGERPITFSFNGGPGSSSVWLHLGVFGPRRVAYADEVGHAGAPPYGVVDNAHSLLDRSDFVFIDPVSTGYSRASGEGRAKDFHGVEPDIASVAEFIRRYITREERWRSPKFIAGESYGTTRAAGLVRELHDTHGIGLNGVVLISSILQFQTARFDTGNDLPYVCFLPTYAATAHYHGALAEDQLRRPIGAFLDEVEAFAAGEYASALMEGDRIDPARARAIAERLAGYTGLSVEYIERTNLRIEIFRFTKELLRERGRTVGRLDSRFTGRDRDSAGERYEYDPSYAAIQSNYTSSMNAYVREELGFASDLPYEILTNVWPWTFGGAANNRYLDVAERMRSVMHKQGHMRVFVASGYYDLATPYFGTEYTMSHLSLAEELRGNIEIHEYEAGHMMYIHGPSLEALREDLAGFYDGAVGG